MKQNNERIPPVIKEGVVKIGDMDIHVCVLDNGERVIPEEDFDKVLAFLGITREEAGEMLQKYRHLL